MPKVKSDRNLTTTPAKTRQQEFWRMDETEFLKDLEVFTLQAYELAKEHLDAEKSLAWKCNIERLAAEVQAVGAQTDKAGERFRIVRSSKNSNQENYASVKIITSKSSTKKVPTIMIAKVDPEPMMTHWTKFPCNIRVKQDALVKNENLADADDIAEHERDKVREIVANSEKEYLQPVNDCEMQKSVEVNKQLKDDQFFEIFVSTLLNYERRVKQPSEERLGVKRYKPGQLEAEISEIEASSVFRAIVSFAPNVGFPYELRERYLRLAKKGEVPEPKAPFHHLRRKDILKPFHKYFCRRCFVYNCLLHDKKEKVEIQHVRPPKTDFQGDAFPCSESCYKHLQWKKRTDFTHPRVTSEAESMHYTEDELDSSVGENKSRSIGYESMLTDCDDNDDNGGASSDSDSIECIREIPWFHRPTRKLTKRTSDTAANDDIQLIRNSAENENEDRKESYLSDSGDSSRNNLDKKLSKLIFGSDTDTEDTTKNHQLTCEGDTWNYDEVSLYLGMKTVAPNQYCYMANVIRTKTCLEVYDRARNDPEKIEPNTCYPLSGKMKKSGGTGEKNKKEQSKSFSSHCKKADMILARSKKPKVLPAYIPCYHPDDECGPDVCSCILNKVPCEKFCGCAPDCVNLYPGCPCTDTCDTKRCNCVLANRECDIDMCGCSIKDKPRGNIPTCKNVNIQNRLGKKVERKRSKVAGWGLFAAESIKINEYIGEYVGELISNSESDIRGEVYDKMKYTFLFGKDDLSAIDGMRFGNLTRFINSSSSKFGANCFPVSMTVYGNLCIGLYASKDIAVGEELLFDYKNVIKQQMSGQQPGSPETSTYNAHGSRKFAKRCHSSTIT